MCDQSQNLFLYSILFQPQIRNNSHRKKRGVEGIKAGSIWEIYKPE